MCYIICSVYFVIYYSKFNYILKSVRIHIDLKLYTIEISRLILRIILLEFREITRVTNKLYLFVPKTRREYKAVLMGKIGSFRTFFLGSFYL